MFDCLTGQYFIYTLSDPRDGTVRYVGMTYRPDTRKTQHRCSASRTPIGGWLDELAEAGVGATFTVIETARGCHSARDKERKWINHFNAIAPVLNRKAGRKARRPEFGVVVNHEVQAHP